MTEQPTMDRMIMQLAMADAEKKGYAKAEARIKELESELADLKHPWMENTTMPCIHHACSINVKAYEKLESRLAEYEAIDLSEFWLTDAARVDVYHKLRALREGE